MNNEMFIMKDEKYDAADLTKLNSHDVHGWHSVL